MMERITLENIVVLS